MQEVKKKYSNGTTHIELRCPEHGFIGHKKQPWESFIMPIGKYRGKLLSWIRKNDTEYLLWASRNITSKNIVSRIDEALSKELSCTTQS